MYIDCLWVSGQFKGHGYSNLQLDACIRDSKEKGKKGLVILSSKKKMGFLADSKYTLQNHTSPNRREFVKISFYPPLHVKAPSFLYAGPCMLLHKA